MKKHKVKGIEVNSTYEIENLYGIDIVDEMTRKLSEDLSKQIDLDILRSMGFEHDRNKRRKNSINKIFNG